MFLFYKKSYLKQYLIEIMSTLKIVRPLKIFDYAYFKTNIYYPPNNSFYKYNADPLLPLVNLLY